MNNDFLIASDNIINNKIPGKLALVRRLGYYRFFCDPEKIREHNDTIVFINGYILPRVNCFQSYNKLSQHELVFRLYSDYGKDFISHIKGVFFIIIINQEEIKIFNDHFGILKLFYFEDGGKFICSNSVKTICEINGSLKLNPVMLAVKSLLNHEVCGNTIYEGIHYTQPASEITLTANLFRIETYFDQDSLLRIDREERSFQYFAVLLKDLVRQYNAFLQPGKSAISLTGGKDSRTVLTSLLANGIIPDGITYGDPDSRDAIYAGLLANKAKMTHHLFDPERSAGWFENSAMDIIRTGNPLINIHRAHRYYAFRKMNEMAGEDLAYYTGYMGGELLMGVYYDNLIFTGFLTDIWEKRSTDLTGPRGILSKYFIRNETIDPGSVEEQLSGLQTIDLNANKKLKQFHGLFEIGVFHHSQDVFLALESLNYPIPLFLDIDFLKEIFQSYYSFLYRDNKTKNLYKRYSLYEFNLNVQHILYPLLDSVPFAKKGSYNTTEFLNGNLYWSLLKSCRYLSEKKNYPPSFSYDSEYKLFLMKWLNEMIQDHSSDIHVSYNVQGALNSLSKQPALSAENKLLPYSLIVMHYLQLKYISK